METKTTSKNKETKKLLSKKKKSNAEKQELSFCICRRIWKERQIGLIVCRICAVRLHEYCIFGLSNTWCENIPIKTDFSTTVLFLDIYVEKFSLRFLNIRFF